MDEIKFWRIVGHGGHNGGIHFGVINLSADDGDGVGAAAAAAADGADGADAALVVVVVAT